MLWKNGRSNISQQSETLWAHFHAPTLTFTYPTLTPTYLNLTCTFSTLNPTSPTPTSKSTSLTSTSLLVSQENQCCQKCVSWFPAKLQVITALAAS